MYYSSIFLIVFLITIKMVVESSIPNEFKMISLRSKALPNIGCNTSIIKANNIKEESEATNYNNLNKTNNIKLKNNKIKILKNEIENADKSVKKINIKDIKNLSNIKNKEEKITFNKC